MKMRRIEVGVLLFNVSWVFHVSRYIWTGVSFSWACLIFSSACLIFRRVGVYLTRSGAHSTQPTGEIRKWSFRKLIVVLIIQRGQTLEANSHLHFCDLVFQQALHLQVALVLVATLSVEAILKQTRSRDVPVTVRRQRQFRQKNRCSAGMTQAF